MTKETKIGLLVGLAFIILFAIILSEKGAPQHDARMPTNFEVTQGHPALPSGSNPTTPLQVDGRLPVERQLDPIVQAPTKSAPTPLIEEPIVVNNPVDEDRLPELPPSVVDLFGNPGEAPNKPAAPTNRSTALVEATGSHGPSLAPLPTRTETPGPATPTLHVEPGGRIPVPKSEVPVRVAVAAGAPISDRLNSASANRDDGLSSDHSAAVLRNAGPEDPVVIKATHTVEPGECISKIASKYYGRSTPDRVKAIVDANQDVLKDHRGVRASDKLRIPELAGYEDKFEAVTGGFNSPHKDAAAPEAKPVASKTSLERPVNTAVASASPAQDGIPRVPHPVMEETKAVADRPASARPTMTADASTVSESKTGGKSGKNDKLAADGKFRWYEVRSGDTLSSIARRELGSERKFKTIFQLNRDVIANQHSLKPGTKIRLPSLEETSMVTAGHLPAGAEP